MTTLGDSILVKSTTDPLVLKRYLEGNSKYLRICASENPCVDENDLFMYHLKYGTETLSDEEEESAQRFLEEMKMFSKFKDDMKCVLWSS